MEIKFKKLHEDAVLPKKAHPSDAGLDLTCVSRDIDGFGRVVTYGCGLAVEIPEGFVGLLFSRSSVYKTGQTLTDCVGVIDAGYRGEVTAKFTWDTRPTKLYEIGERFAQLVIVPIYVCEPVFADTLNEGDRGDNSYGSSGK